ncbi:MAG: PD-(D/E)XK nuclease family protein [Acidimicrobiia bacterium]|nr:PD-(D/E)XK nuclease family protein [Acidimicrobiia bacterium]
MAFELPRRLSPSKVSSFKDCALAFRFSAIDRLPEPASLPAIKGTLVHAALERLFCLPAPDRTVDAALACLADAFEALRQAPEVVGLELDAEAEAAFVADADRLVRNYFLLEDPRTFEPIGVELRLQVQVGGLDLVGVIDRLDLDPQGELVVTDYKTGRAPTERHEQRRLGGVHFYSLLCEELFGRRPARVQLLHLQEPVALTALPSDQSTQGLRVRVGAIWQAVERACATEDFRPRPGPLCDWCAFQAYCPAFGGDPADATAAAAAAAAEAVAEASAAGDGHRVVGPGTGSPVLVSTP